MALDTRTTSGSKDRELEAVTMRRDADSLAVLAALCPRDKVQNDSPNTIDAKTCDLVRVVHGFAEMKGLCGKRGERTHDTLRYSRQLDGTGLAASSVNCAFAVLRHLARWAPRHKHLDDHPRFEYSFSAKGQAPALFLLTRGGSNMHRESFVQALRHIGNDASEHRKTPIVLHPPR